MRPTVLRHKEGVVYKASAIGIAVITHYFGTETILYRIPVLLPPSITSRRPGLLSSPSKKLSCQESEVREKSPSPGEFSRSGVSIAARCEPVIIYSAPNAPTKTASKGEPLIWAALANHRTANDTFRPSVA